MENILGIIFFFVLVGIGFMVAAVLINLVFMAIAAVFMFIGWVFEKLTGKRG